jgi:glycosyltransferase involved in cell wall biosynthesis
VSVVVAVYNKELHLNECVRSVLEQPGVALEVICVDDCSTDSSWKILKRLRRLDRRVKLVRHPANLGPAVARNTGIEHATGRYLQFTDADDLLAPGALASLHAAAMGTGAEAARGLLQKLDKGVLAPWTGEVAEQVVPESRSFPELQATPQMHTGALLDLPELWIPWFHTCFLISGDLVARHGIRYPALAQGEDPVFLSQVLTAAGSICVLPEQTYIYRIWEHRPRRGFADVRDYFAHAEMVKHIYGRRFSPCWETYGPYIKVDLAYLVERAELQEPELRWARARLSRFPDNGRPAFVLPETAQSTHSVPAVSVVMPCRNAERHVVRQLEALASQETWFPWELVVVDNGSTDRSIPLAQGFADRMPVRIVVAPERPNQAYARNVGVLAARADKLIFVDADDEVSPGFLAEMYTALQENAFVTSRVDIASLNAAWSQYAHAVPDSTDSGGRYIPPLANGCALGIRRGALAAVGGCPEEYDEAWDLAISCRLHLAGVSLASLSTPLYRYRFRDSIIGLFRQTRVWGAYQARAHREFGSALLPQRAVRVVAAEWGTAWGKLLTARSRGHAAQCAVRFGYCLGRLQGSVRYRTLYL